MKNKKWSFQNLQVASDVINLNINVCKNGTLNIKNAEIINDELIVCIFKVVTLDEQ